jgi:hypothetical protein
MSGPEKSTEQSHSSRAVLCAKCEHLNPHGMNVCERCRAHLHVVCHNCGQRNERVRTRCLECNHNLHRSGFGRLIRSFFGKDRKMSVIQTTLLIVAILIGFAMIVFFSSSWNPPSS